MVQTWSNTGIVELRFQARASWIAVRNAARKEYVTNGATDRHRRLAHAMWKLNARWYRRSGMIDSMDVCLKSAATFAPKGS